MGMGTFRVPSRHLVLTLGAQIWGICADPFDSALRRVAQDDYLFFRNRGETICPDCERVGVFCCLLLIGACSPPHPNHPVVGAKNFTEQVILGELLAQEIEAKTGLPVERRFYLAGSYIAQQALVAGRIDAYVEYTGTALTAILKQPLAKDPDAVLATVTRLYRQRYNVVVAPPLGFENTFAMVVRGEEAKRLNVHTLERGGAVRSEMAAGRGL